MGIGALLTLLASVSRMPADATRHAREIPLDRLQYEELMSRRVARIDELLEWFYDQQAAFCPLIPPGTEAFVQPGSPEVLVLDLAVYTWPSAFVRGLAETKPTYRNSVPTYDLDLRETIDGAIEIRTADGSLLHAEPASGSVLTRSASLDRGGPREAIHDAEWARYALIARVTLLPLEYVEHCLFAAARIAEAAEVLQEREENESSGMMRLMGGATEDVWICAMTRATNGLRLELSYPEEYSGLVWSVYSLDVPVCMEQNCAGSATNSFMGLHSMWTLIDNNVVLTGSTQTIWLDTRPLGLGAQSNAVHRFYAFGANTDTDGDGLSDSMELFVTKTDPGLADTDGDGMEDGWEHAHGLDPTSAAGLDGADGDPDGDGLSNALEFKLGLDSQAANPIVKVPAGNIAIERDGVIAGLQKCGYSDFETGNRKYRRVTYG